LIIDRQKITRLWKNFLRTAALQSVVSAVAQKDYSFGVSFSTKMMEEKAAIILIFENENKERKSKIE